MFYYVSIAAGINLEVIEVDFIKRVKSEISNTTL